MTTPRYNTELIDAYLAGTLSEEEKKQFERLLSARESSLRDEMQLQKDIILAIRSRGLHEMLEREQRRLNRRQILRRTFSWIGGSMASLAAAAAIVVWLVIVPVANTMYNESNRYAEQLQAPAIIRGGTPFCPIVEAIKADDWKLANRLAEDCMRQNEERATAEQEDLYEQARWLRVQCMMHLRHPLQAKRLLKQIAAEGGYYSEQAQEILDSID